MNSTTTHHSALKLVVSAATTIGKMREENQDNFLVNGRIRRREGTEDSVSFENSMEEPTFFAVFDGLGGEENGGLASRIAAETLREYTCTPLSETAAISDVFNSYACEANRKVCRALESVYYSRGGTTFAAVMINEGIIHPYYLGDSRVYLATEEGFYLLTEDHTIATEMVKSGKMTPEEAKKSHEHHMLTEFLGARPGVPKIQAQQCAAIRARAGMRLLLCTDGVYDLLDKQELWEILMTHEQDAAQALIALTLQTPAYDNATCVVVDIAETGSER